MSHTHRIGEKELLIPALQIMVKQPNSITNADLTEKLEALDRFRDRTDDGFPKQVDNLVSHETITPYIEIPERGVYQITEAGIMFILALKIMVRQENGVITIKKLRQELEKILKPPKEDSEFSQKVLKLILHGKIDPYFQIINIHEVQITEEGKKVDLSEDKEVDPSIITTSPEELIQKLQEIQKAPS